MSGFKMGDRVAIICPDDMEPSELKYARQYEGTGIIVGKYDYADYIVKYDKPWIHGDSDASRPLWMREVTVPESWLHVDNVIDEVPV